MPGTTQLTARDILYRLQMSKAKGIVTTDTLAPEVDSVASECPALKTKLLVSDHSREGWLDFRSLVKWVYGLRNGRTPFTPRCWWTSTEAHQVWPRNLFPDLHWCAVWPWASTFPSLGCNWFICKIRKLNFHDSVTKVQSPLCKGDV